MSWIEARRVEPGATLGLVISHPPDRRLLLEFLKGLRYSVLTGLPAVGKDDEWAQVNLILVDEPAARLHGKELLRLKEQAGGEFLPILLLLPSQMASQPWFEAGFDDVLRMPLRQADLASRIKTYLSLRDQIQERFHSVARFRSVWESSSDALALSDADGIVLAANPAYYLLYGLQPQQVLGQKFYRMFPEESHAQVMDRYRAVFERAQPITAVESLVRRTDGTERSVETYVDFVVLNGKQRVMLSSIRDITARKQAETELRQAKEELEQRVAERTADITHANEELRRLTQQLVQAQENERRRVALELHDEIGQTLTAVRLNLQLLADLDPDEVQAHLAESLRIIQFAIEQVRNLSFELRPTVLDEFGLAAGLESYMKRQAQRLELDLHLNLDPKAIHLPQEVETICFRIAQEAFTNIARHARAKNVWVKLQHHKKILELRIRDDGIGFDLEEVLRPEHGSGLGLSGMQERIELVKGQLEIRSMPGIGSEIWARIPLPAVRSRRTPKIPQSKGGMK